MNRQINTCYEIVNSSLANNLSSINHHHPKKNQRKQTCNIPTFRSFSVKKVVRMKNIKLRDFPREKDEIRGKISRLDPAEPQIPRYGSKFCGTRKLWVVQSSARPKTVYCRNSSSWEYKTYLAWSWHQTIELKLCVFPPTVLHAMMGQTSWDVSLFYNAIFLEFLHRGLHVYNNV